MKMGIYGGSFNPPHYGHLRMANYMRNELKLDKIMIIPSNISPQKSDNGNIDPIHRINMCKIMFSDSVFEVSDMEIKRGGKSYTVDTVSEIKKSNPEAKLFLLMGSDMFLSFGAWYEPEKIAEMCTICTLSRNRSETTAKMRDYAHNFVEKGNIVIFDKTPYEMSSTAVREMLLSGDDCTNMLAPGVIKYIKENKLYGQK